ncbi:dienelactone hydrolase [Aphanothece hegewaldii CCALA 016]|uniref:Dienelactone hydrolase n=1 Tax=Aphanothece hegewaldii CCALA 016 TaxID=2107694 RepID=A0A2T1LVH3_9CHRO|nr:alpha/beta hydrolase [Aphanothece hegewaldii]PSF35716.1 dienelactone hydrolase [Aphanothece hegewaldii CCALA 016]
MKAIFKPYAIAAGILTNILTNIPVYAANKVDLIYGPFNFPVSVQSLETFAKEGKVKPDVAFFINRLTPQQKKQLSAFLDTPYPISSIMLSRLSHTYSGHRVLSFVGEVIQLPGGRSGYYGIRAAIVQAAADSKGLTVLNVLQKFPTDVQIDVRKGKERIQEAKNLALSTSVFVKQLSLMSATNNNVKPIIDSSKQPSFIHSQATQTAFYSPSYQLDLRQLGQLHTVKQTQTFFDSKRNRKIIVDLYLPKTTQSQLPVIIISNGLGARRDRFEQLAHHLTSHGFAVVIPDHPRSNAQRQKDFYEGYYKESFDATEYIDRPLDITFVLDELEKLSSNQLNLKQIGIFGYSFGGTTALALAGATINFNQLDQDCSEDKSIINISIVHQCRALELPRKTYLLKDNRIKAAYVFVPFGKSLYGKAGISQIDIPIFWQATDEDLITPLLIEQTPAFSWLTTPDKYFSLAEKLPHTRIGLSIMNQLIARKLPVDKLLQLTQTYLSALNLAFFKVYIAQDEQYRPYLQQSYADVLTEKPYNLLLVKSLQISPNSSVNSK